MCDGNDVNVNEDQQEDGGEGGGDDDVDEGFMDEDGKICFNRF